MSVEWARVRLEEVVDFLAGFAFKSSFYAEDRIGPRLCLGANVAPGAPDWTKLRFWPQSMCEGVDRYSLADGDVVLAMDRPWIPGGLKVFRFTKADGPALLVQRVARLRGTSRLDSGYLHAVIRHPAFTDYILGVQTGTTVPHISAGQILGYEIELPPLHEQRRIAAVLGALDDKIELNRKMNRTLEEMAQAIFKSWFIDFDGHDDLVDSEIGPVPRGWEVRSLGDATEITMGQSPPGSTYNGDGDGLPFFQGATDFGSVFPTNRVYCSAPTRLAEEWDVLMSVRAPVGRTNLALERCAIGRGVASLRSQGGRYPAYAWCLVNSLSAALDVYNGEGTVFGSINKKALHALPVVRPPADRVVAFDALGGPLLSRLRVGEEEARTLAALRDTLLPKLISGELRVPAAEAVVESPIESRKGAKAQRRAL